MPSYVNRYVPEISQAKTLTGKVDIAAVTVATVGEINNTVTIQGAEVGDYVIATPTVDFSLGRTGYFAFVSESNVVTIKYFNPSAAAEAVTATTFNIMVIKNGVSL